MKTGTITAREFLKGARPTRQGRGTHNYQARLEASAVVVVDENGKRVKMQFGGSADNRTCYAHVEGVGFIGGWQYPHRAQPFCHLVEYINRGILYYSMDDLPKASTRS